MRIAKPLAKLIDSFGKLPGVGPKSAQRLSYYLLHVPQGELDRFADALSNLKKNTMLCGVCRNVSETDPCPVCADNRRDKSMIMVVEQPLDVLAFEKTGKYLGAYHVLHGAINPLDNIGPDEIYITDLYGRLEGNGVGVSEVVIATNPTMDGEATAMYLKKEIEERKPGLRITRLGVGVPTGADLEYADERTLTQAIEGRREY